MFQFLHAADVHLDSPLKGLERYEEAPVDEIRQATRRALENLVGLALEERVDFLLIAGDLYDDNWRDFKTGRFFVAQMAKLREEAIPVFLVAGNHDAANKMTKDLRLPANVRKFDHKRAHTERLEDLGVAIHGQSFGKAAVSEDLSAGYPPAVAGLFNIGLLHTCATGREGHLRYAPCTVEGLLAKEYQYWALGHVHRRETVHEDPPIVFPGNLQGRNVREPGAKGCTLVTVDDRQHVRVEPRWVDVFRWATCRVDASVAESGDDLLERIRKELAGLHGRAEGRSMAVRVEVEGPSRSHPEIAGEPERWENEIRALGQEVGDLWIEKVKLRTSAGENLETSLSAEGPIGELVRLIAEVRSSSDQLASFGGELAPLVDKLPRELREGPESIRLDAPETIRESLDHVEQILVRKLLSREASS